MLKYKNIKVVQHYDWNDFITRTFRRPYCIEYQANTFCNTDTIHLSVPSEYPEDEDMNNDIPKDIRTTLQGVKLKTWIEADPKTSILNEEGTEEQLSPYNNHIIDFWENKFYPDLKTLGNYLNQKGLLEEGNYIIELDN